jgi:hypothetical protein
VNVEQQRGHHQVLDEEERQQALAANAEEQKCDGYLPSVALMCRKSE